MAKLMWQAAISVSKIPMLIQIIGYWIYDNHCVFSTYLISPSKDVFKTYTLLAIERSLKNIQEFTFKTIDQLFKNNR